MTYSLAFDIYDTLINTSGIQESLEKLIGEKAKSFADSWRSKQLEYSFRRGLMNDYVDFSICTKQALDFCCLQYKVKLTTSQRQQLLWKYKELPVFPDVIEGLQTLKSEGHKISAFSNGTKKDIHSLLYYADIIHLFDHVVSLEEIQSFKPDPLAYEHFIETTASKKENTYLISSNSFDILGAMNSGLQSIWIQRNEENSFDPWEKEPNFTTNSISKIVDLLKD